MTDLTPLDLAHAKMQSAPGDDAARLRFYERLADSELFLLLEKEAEGDDIAPELFDLDGGSFVLVFDRQERLAAFVGKPAPYAALSGRLLVAMLSGQGIGLGVNLEVAPSSILIPDTAVQWLEKTLTNAPTELQARPVSVDVPKGLPEVLIGALDTKLATSMGLARTAYLVAVTYEDGRKSHLLAFVDTVPGAESALAKAAAEVLTFSGVAAGELDVAFFATDDPICAPLAKVGLRFDLPEPVMAQATGGVTAPGMDPENPPRLR